MIEKAKEIKMIKSIFQTMVLNKKGMKNICSIKEKVFAIFFLVTNILFPILFCVSVGFITKKYSVIECFWISVSEIKNTIFFNLLLYCFLLAAFYIQSKGKKYFGLLFKNIVAMNFVYPIFSAMEYFLQNVIFSILAILYYIVFTILFLKTNIVDENLTAGKQKVCIIFSFIIMLVVYGFVYKLLLMN